MKLLQMQVVINSWTYDSVTSLIMALSSSSGISNERWGGKEDNRAILYEKHWDKDNLQKAEEQATITGAE